MLKSRKVISGFVAIVMALSVCCVSAFAADTSQSSTPDIVAAARASLSGTTYVQKATSTNAPAFCQFTATKNGKLYFYGNYFTSTGVKFNVALVRQLGSSPSNNDEIISVVEDTNAGLHLFLGNVKVGNTYYLRASTYYAPGTLNYTVEY